MIGGERGVLLIGVVKRKRTPLRGVESGVKEKERLDVGFEINAEKERPLLGCGNPGLKVVAIGVKEHEKSKKGLGKTWAQ